MKIAFWEWWLLCIVPTDHCRSLKPIIQVSFQNNPVLKVDTRKDVVEPR